MISESCWPSPLLLSSLHSGTQILQHLRRAHDAQALSLGFGIAAGQSGPSPGRQLGGLYTGHSPCVWAAGPCAFRTPLSVCTHKVSICFCCLMIMRYLTSGSHSSPRERCQLPMGTRGALHRVSPLLTWPPAVPSHESLPLVQPLSCPAPSLWRPLH